MHIYSFRIYTLHIITLVNFFLKQLCLKYRLGRLVERQGVILFRLTRDIHSTKRRRIGGNRKNEEEARENVRRQRASGLAGGNNRPRRFESSPTNSHKLVFSSARERGRGREWDRGKEGGFIGMILRGEAENVGLHGSRPWPCR